MDRVKQLPENFEMIYDHLKELVFVNDNYDPNLQVSGKLMLRELFMQAQNIIPDINYKLFTAFNMILVGSYFFTQLIYDYVRDKNDIEDQKERSLSYWIYHVMIFMDLNIF